MVEGKRQERTGRPPHVVVVGGGFAGLSAVRELAEGGARVTLVDHNAYTTFQPLLYQVATAAMAAGDVTFPLRAFAAKYPTVRVHPAGLGKLLLDQKQVELADGAVLDYDYLVLGTGVSTNWLAIEGAEKNAQPLYSVRDAKALRTRLQTCLEETALGKRPSTHVVVVGGGATGVEIAGSMAELRMRTLPLTHPEIKPDQTSVTLVERFDYVLAPYKPHLRDAAARDLRKREVRLRLGSTVASVEPDAVVLADGTRLHSDVTVWALGVTAPKEVADCGLPQGKGGRVVVTERLNLSEHPEVYVVGDLALPPEPLPQLAQPAIQMGKLIAGTPINASITYTQVIVDDVTKRLRNSEIVTALGAGSLVLVNDGENVKVEQGLTTAKKKIRSIRARQAVATDIEKTARDNYIGKLDNNEGGRDTLFSAIKSYLETLQDSNVLSDPIVAQDAQNPSVGDKVFVTIGYTEVDSMERIFLSINL